MLVSLLRQRNFTLIWWAGLISGVGNGALFIALPVYLYAQTHSTLATALGVTSGALATTIVGQVAGVWVDRWNLRRTLIWTNLALCLITLAFLAVQHAPWGYVLPVAFVQAAISQFLGPAENTLLPRLVGSEYLTAANSLNALNNNLARLIGPALGGVLIASVGFAGVIVVDALTFLLAAGLVALVRLQAPIQAPTAPPTRHFWHEWRAGLEAVRSSPLLKLSFLAAALVGFGEGFVSTLMAPWAAVMLGNVGRELGVLMSVQAVGGMLAGVLLAAFASRFSALRLLGWGGLLSGMLLLLIFNVPLILPALWPPLLLTAIAGLPFTAWGTAQMLLLQTQSGLEVRGRVFGAYSACFGGAQLIGMAVSGVLGDALGVPVINVDAVTYLLAGAVVLAFSVRTCLARTSVS